MHPLIREVQLKQLKKVPEIRTGYTILVQQKIKEGEKTRLQAFEGLVIKVSHGEGIERTMTVRKIVEGIGVEKIFLIHSANIEKIIVKKKAKVRRSKLYYMRERSGKSARLKERHVNDDERMAEEARISAKIDELQKEDVVEAPVVENVIETPVVEEVVETPAVEEVVEAVTEEKVEAPKEDAA